MLTLEDGQTGNFGKVARCHIELELRGDEARARSTLTFTGTSSVERVLFSLIGRPLRATVDGREVAVLNTEGITSHCVWAVDTTVRPGAELVIESRLRGVFRTTPEGVVWSAQTNDGDSDPHYLDRVAASGFEHDSYPVTLSLHGVPPGHVLYSNGRASIDGETATMVFPAWFSPSCQWWLLVPETFPRVRVELHAPWRAHDGSSGDVLDTVFLSEDIAEFEPAIERTRVQLQKLTERFGPWPHPTLRVFLTTRQSMEYAGATCTELRHLEHELTHSYFGRCVLPYDGSSGWIDEGIVTWLDTGLPVRGLDDLPVSGCGLTEPWRRGGSRVGYYAGASIMGLTETRLAGSDKSVDGFLRELLARYRWRQIQTHEFLALLQEYAGEWVREAAARAILTPSE